MIHHNVAIVSDAGPAGSSAENGPLQAARASSGATYAALAWTERASR
jgi:hypothetical protein